MSSRLRFGFGLVGFVGLGVGLVIACGNSSDTPPDSGDGGGASSGNPATSGGPGTGDGAAGTSGGPGAGGALCDPASASACTGQGRKCDPTLGCVECTAAADGADGKNTDCTAANRDPFCIHGRCEACRTNTDCGAAAPVCYPGDHRCHLSCINDGGARCGATEQCDQTTGACVQCTTNADCPAATGRPLCQPDTRTCVACLANTDCPVTSPKCDLAVYRCVQCFVNTDCSGSTPVCNINHECQPGCTSDANCTNAALPKCNTGTGRCQQCASPTDCTSVAGKPLCPTTGDLAGRCVQCSVNSDCGDGGTPFCRDAVCMQCVRRQDCPGGNAQCDNGTCR